jgi:hypothetical protein
MIVLAATLGLVSLSRAQEPVPGAAAPTAVEVLDALALRVNALPGFHALFRLSRPGAEQRTFELRYAAPDRMRLDMGGAEPGTTARVWSVEQRMCMLESGQGGKQAWASIDYRELEKARPAALDTLHRLFPGDVPTIEPGPALDASWRLDPRSNKVDFQITLSWVLSERTTPVGWLRTLRREPELLEVRGDALVQEHARYRAVVSRATGFLAELDMLGADGVKAELRLVELELEPAWDEAVFVPPARPESASDVSAQVGKSLAAMFHPVAVRRECYGRVERQLADGLVDWQEPTRAAWINVMRALHEPLMQEPAADFLEEHRRHLAALAEWIAKERAGGRPIEALREQVDLKRADLVRQIERAASEGLTKVQASDPEEHRSPRFEDLRAAEREVHAELYRELYVRPALEELDAVVARALGG